MKPLSGLKAKRVSGLKAPVKNILGRMLLGRIKPVRREAELKYWRNELVHLKEWFEEGTRDWWGIRPPDAEKKLKMCDLWQVNAVMTINALRPNYHEELHLDGNHFAGMRVLEIGCGPLAPILQFANCTRHCIDPLVNRYLAAGWPLFAYDAKFVNTAAECMPYPDGYFDAAISVNALDHVDDFERTAAEMSRVVKRGGHLFFEVEYHEPTITEPIRLHDERVREAFSRCDLTIMIKRTGREMFQQLVKRFDLLPNQFHIFGSQLFVTWHGVVR